MYSSGKPGAVQVDFLLVDLSEGFDNHVAARGLLKRRQQIEAFARLRGGQLDRGRAGLAGVLQGAPDIGSEGLDARLRIDGLAGLAREMTADLGHSA